MPPGMPHTKTVLPFASSDFLTLGVEVEAYLVDPVSGDAVGRSPDVLELLAKDARFRPESLTTLVEFATGVCTELSTVDPSCAVSQPNCRGLPDRWG